MNWFRKTIFSSRFWMGQNKFSDVPSTLSVTIVIPAWNEEDYIAATIESVLAQDYPCQVIVVNDRSTDRTSEIAHSYAGVRVIDVEDKAGSKSQALNRAIPFVETDIFICVDADTELDTNSVSRLLRAFNNPDVMVASGFVVSKHDRNFWQAARCGDYIIGQSLVKTAQENLNAVQVASGCFFAIRTPLLKQYGFDDRTLAEDMDLTWIAIESGYDVAFVKDANCYVNDPDTWYLYNKQVYRWYAGMFQCIRQRKFDLFSKNPKLGFAVYFYSLSALTGAPMTLAALAIGFTYYAGITAAFVALLYALMLAIALSHGIANKHSMKRYPIYVAAMMIASFINYGIFVKAMIDELVFNKNLKIWIKGH
jgi:cellulose synthase/poly-beta-1,6-N-acetylglucosamine synthase-like glycosyltransferase